MVGQPQNSTCEPGTPMLLVDSTGSVIDFVTQQISGVVALPVETELTVVAGTITADVFSDVGGALNPALIDSGRRIILSASSSVGINSPLIVPADNLSSSSTVVETVGLLTGFDGTTWDRLRTTSASASGTIASDVGILASGIFATDNTNTRQVLADTSGRLIISPSSTVTFSPDYTYTDSEIPSPYYGISMGFKNGTKFYLANGNTMFSGITTTENAINVKSSLWMVDNFGSAGTFSPLRSISAFNGGTISASNALAVGITGYDGTNNQFLRSDTAGNLRNNPRRASTTEILTLTLTSAATSTAFGTIGATVRDVLIQNLGLDDLYYNVGVGSVNDASSSATFLARGSERFLQDVQFNNFGGIAGTTTTVMRITGLGD